MKAFCRRLNEEARQGGEVLVGRTHSVEMRVAEDFLKYKTENKSDVESGIFPSVG